MIEKVKQNKNILGLALMIVLTSVTQVFILLKSSLVAGIFGISAEMDAYNLANSVTSFLYGILAAGIPTIVIPSYVKKEPAKVINTFLTIIYGSIFIMSLLIAVLRVQIIGSLSNRDDVFINITCSLLVILLFAQFLSSVTGVTEAFFLCEGKYNISKTINLISQIIVVLLLILVKNITIYQYALIIAGGLIFNFLVNFFYASKNGWRYLPGFDISDKRVKSLLIVFIPIIFSSGVYKLTLFVDSILASRLNEGMITVLSYSNQIAGMIDTVLIGNLLIYAYPKIVKNIQDGANQDKFWRLTVLFHNIVLLVVAGFIAVGNEGIGILFSHGYFTDRASFFVYSGALLYIVGQQTSTIINLIYRYFYSIGDTKTTATNSLIISILNLGLSIFFVNLIGFYGIILGTILSSLISLILIIIQFKTKIGLNNSFRLALKGYFKNIILVCLVVGVIVTTKKFVSIDSRLIAIFVFGIETVVIYGLFTFLFNKKVLYTLKEL